MTSKFAAVAAHNSVVTPEQRSAGKAEQKKTPAPKGFRFDDITRSQLHMLALAMRDELGGARAPEAAVLRVLIAKEFKRRGLGLHANDV